MRNDWITRARNAGHAARYARMSAWGGAEDLADAVGAVGLSFWVHDRWLLAGLAWEWRLSPNRVGEDLFSRFVAERAERAARARRPEVARGGLTQATVSGKGEQ